ncbi:hypothetical protein [Amycolatopsis anabasis]|uniref:hypothetical protein n=1 Tax=Amycolatopsis anabasis TaxID=1840409 RepID=UPI00131D11ED|nr:hypothetical protein [Amycolatopsis anabasis]
MTEITRLPDRNSRTRQAFSCGAVGSGNGYEPLDPCTGRVYASDWVNADLDDVENATAPRAGRCCRTPATVYPLWTICHPMSGISSHRFRFFTGSGAVRGGEPESAESVRIDWIALDEVPALLTGGRIADGPTVTALATYLATRSSRG